MPTCSFCKERMEPGTGKMYIKADGTVLHFTGSKCEKNFLKLKRKPLKTKWTKSYHDEKKKRLKTEAKKK